MTPEQIREALARHITAAKARTPGGQLLPQDMPGLYRRTASECGVTLEDVKEAEHG
jgi:hypothetical protein